MPVTTLSDHATLVAGLAHTLHAQTGEQVSVIETHISSMLLCGEHAFKFKKPLSLGFLDFSTLEHRRHCCEEEVRLNQRTAPDIYLDVAGVRPSPEHRIPPRRVIARAVKRRSKPFLAFEVLAAAAREGSAGVPAPIERAIRTAVKLARRAP